MRSRMPLVVLVLLPVALLPILPPEVPPAPPDPPGPLVLPPFDFDRIADKPFAVLPPEEPDRPKHPGWGWQCSLSPDLRHLVSGPVQRGREEFILWRELLSPHVVRPELVPRRRGTPELTSADGSVWLETVLREQKVENHHWIYSTRLHTPATGEIGLPVAPEVTDRDVLPMALSPDGKLLYIADGQHLRAWATFPLRPLRMLSTIETKPNMRPQGFGVLPSPDGRFVAVLETKGCSPHIQQFCGHDYVPPPYHLYYSDHDRVRVWNTADWTLAFDFERDECLHHEWAADGRLVSRDFDPRWPPGSTMWEPTVFRTEFRDPVNGRVERRRGEIPADGFKRRIVTSRDGGAAVVWGESEERGFSLHDLLSNRPPKVFRCHATPSEAAFTNDRRFLIVLFMDGSTALYDLCGVTKPPANYTAVRLWADLSADDPLTVYRAARWAVEHPTEAIPVLRERAERQLLGSREESLSRLPELLTVPQPDTPDGRRSRWAVFVLEQIGTPEAKGTLRDWALHLRPFGLTAEAYRAVQRLGGG